MSFGIATPARFISAEPCRPFLHRSIDPILVGEIVEACIDLLSTNSLSTMEKQPDDQPELRLEASTINRKRLGWTHDRHWREFSIEVPIGDILFQNRIMLAMSGPAGNSWRNRIIELHEDDEPDTPVSAEDTKQRANCVKRLPDYDAALDGSGHIGGISAFTRPSPFAQFQLKYSEPPRSRIFSQ
jgi:hypothetical protein